MTTNITTIMLGVSAGMSLYAGITHLLIGLHRPRSWTHLTFSLVSFSIAPFIVMGIFTYHSTTVSEYIRWAKGQLAFLYLTALLGPWFIAAYARLKRYDLAVITSGLFAIILVVHTFSPLGILYHHADHLREIKLPWGEIYRVVVADPNPWSVLMIPANFMLWGFAFYASYDLYRRDEYYAGILLGIVTSILTAATIFDLLFDSLTLNFIYLTEYGYIALVFIMSIRLSTEFIRTREALSQLNTELEARVFARTEELAKANNRLSQEKQNADTRRQIAEGLQDILVALNANQPVEEILRLIIQQMSPFLGSAANAIVSQASEGTPFIPIYVDITGDIEALPPAVLKKGYDTLHQALQQRTPVSDISVQSATDDYRTILALPLLAQDVFRGGFLLYFTQNLRFSDEELALAVTFSEQIELALENMQLRKQIEEMAIMGERSRLARELHDAVTQNLFSAVTIADALPRLWQTYPQEAQQSMEDLRLLTRGALAEMRSLLVELRPDALTEKTLEELLEQLAQAVMARTRINITTTVMGEFSLPPQVHIMFYRIAQEALNNMVKHTSTKNVSLKLFNESKQVKLAIQGNGFGKTKITGDQLGSKIMQERAQAVGAAVTVDSQPGQGTTITVSWHTEKILES